MTYDGNVHVHVALAVIKNNDEPTCKLFQTKQLMSPDFSLNSHIIDRFIDG
jgi:hypothetical protein